LTIKFTRHTAAPPSLRMLSFRAKRGICFFHPDQQISLLSHYTPRKLYGPRSAHRALNALTLSRPSKSELLGTHKNLQPCRLPNLFSCQISSSRNRR